MAQAYPFFAFFLLSAILSGCMNPAQGPEFSSCTDLVYFLTENGWSRADEHETAVWAFGPHALVGANAGPVQDELHIPVVQAVPPGFSNFTLRLVVKAEAEAYDPLAGNLTAINMVQQGPPRGTIWLPNPLPANEPHVGTSQTRYDPAMVERVPEVLQFHNRYTTTGLDGTRVLLMGEATTEGESVRSALTFEYCGDHRPGTDEE